ncbi:MULTISPECIES: alpha/beta hydrolase [Agrobacterium]|jgi:pimeloyl-ACP methyl ester carboxylesterase|uniref:alpha/beta hydrolase n=1 Tax=Agrobacterium TaxID=357 RepID=UPI00027D618D|nr:MULTISPECIES: alpha/beta hydrolase [Agrobacterium]AUC10998.1 alpha/beta hydrolase [Rhizobium sp. Y9]KIV62063.1 2-hydroxymuconic semialdehyde hydrolase [Rhizobium sp. UR51a]MDP9775034.1 pimeloyl-ACP methyl ester carboxylesterase [Rhizobium sp. SORGH_AS_0755]OAI90882.1 2-hydroxymuconic semialdehyde hydrolase [Rhizobium sp. GHKF11]MBA8798479.1 pimeloyl-ACP methyl ester carboxylesterase [Agrobacterium sp. RC10-4-1]
MSEQAAEFLRVGPDNDSREIAILHRPAISGKSEPMLVWLGGYRSDMTGTKAVELDRFAAENGLACLRFDYSGHGASGGDFKKGTISRWLEEALAVVRAKAPSSVILVGSSMGGWIALRMVEELRKTGGTPTVAGLILIAPAPDFTAELIEPSLTEAEKTSLLERGYFEEHSEYSPEPNIFTRALMEDGRQNRVLQGIITTGCPVHILQGMRDPDVPYQHALKLLEHLPADDVVLTLIRDGDHRLSRPQDIERMLTAVRALAT